MTERGKCSLKQREPFLPAWMLVKPPVTFVWNTFKQGNVGNFRTVRLGSHDKWGGRTLTGTQINKKTVLWEFLSNCKSQSSQRNDTAKRTSIWLPTYKLANFNIWKRENLTVSSVSVYSHLRLKAVWGIFDIAIDWIVRWSIAHCHEIPANRSSIYWPSQSALQARSVDR